MSAPAHIPPEQDSSATAADLDRRLSRKIEIGKGTQLSRGDLDLLVQSGAIDTFRAYVSQIQREQCANRNPSTNAGPTVSRSGPIERISTSSGTTKGQGESAAVARAQQKWGKRKTP